MPQVRGVAGGGGIGFGNLLVAFPAAEHLDRNKPPGDGGGFHPHIPEAAEVADDVVAGEVGILRQSGALKEIPHIRSVGLRAPPRQSMLGQQG